MTVPDIYPAFYRFAAVIGAFLGVAAMAVVIGFAAVWKIFAPKKEEEK